MVEERLTEQRQESRPHYTGLEKLAVEGLKVFLIYSRKFEVKENLVG